jgi:hypothetical protein
MTADAYYAIGATHLSCQDYALASEGGRPHVVVSDGCSGAELSDLGARLLTMAASRLLAGADAPFRPERVLERAAAMARALELPASCLDATLLCAWQDDGLTRVSLTGDGVVAARRRDGLLESWAVSYDDSAPAYLSYLLDPTRLDHYLAEHGTRRIRRLLGGWTLVDRTEHLSSAPYGFELALPLADYPLVLLFSDGVCSFVARGDDGSRRLRLEEVLEPLVDLKSHCGRFLTRRARRFLRKTCAERGWSHEDDLAIAGIHTDPAGREP